MRLWPPSAAPTEMMRQNTKGNPVYIFEILTKACYTFKLIVYKEFRPVIHK